MRKKTIIALYREFEQTHAAYQAVPDVEGAGPKRYEQLLGKASAIARRIAAAPAADIDEMLLKLRVTAWDIGDRPYRKLEELDTWQPHRQLSQGAHYLALASLRDDLNRLREVDAEVARSVSRLVRSSPAKLDRRTARTLARARATAN